MKAYNFAPYYDDYNEEKKFYKILFRPGYAVQARELTQLQTALQYQIKRHSDHVFKEGAMVIPGQSSVDTEISYIKLQPTTDDINTYIGEIIENSSGLQAKIIHAVAAEASDPPTLFVKYTTSDDNESQVFADNDVLSIGLRQVQTVENGATGNSSIATIEKGVYYIFGHFALVETQTIVLDKYSNNPTYRIGLTVNERTITPEQDVSILDNAQGSNNYAAPGAHRYYIDLVLTKKSIDSVSDSNFIELVRVVDGDIQRIKNKTEYSEIEKTLARRTYDESGNYTVRPFAIDIREHRDNDRGPWSPDTSYLIGDIVISNNKKYVAKRNGISSIIAPSHSSGVAFDGTGNTGVQWEYNENPYYNRGIYKPDAVSGIIGDESKLAIGLEPGKAYVEGYEIEKISTEYIQVNKSRESVQVDNAIIPTTVGNYVFVTNVNNAPPVHTFANINIYNRIVTSKGVAPSEATLIGTAKVRFIEWDSGTIGEDTAIYKIGIFDVKMNAGFDFNRDSKSFYFNVSNDPNLSFTANIDPILTRLIGSSSASDSTTINGIGTSFQTDLRENDYVSFNGVLRRVTSIQSQSQLTVDSAITLTGSTIDRVSVSIQEPNNLSLVYQFPYFAIKSVRSKSNTNDTLYTVYERLTSSTGNDIGGFCSMTISTTSGSFAPSEDNANYIVIDNDANSGGAIIKPTSILVIGSTATITLPGQYAGKSFIIIAAIDKSGAILTEKTKTLRLAGQSGTIISRTTAATATLQSIPLSKADCYRLISVKMMSGTFDSPGGSYVIDITDRYEFDNGQRDTHYDIGRINLKPSYQPPSAPIQITFEYFDHSEGDYFTVNSYGDYSTTTSNTTNIAYSSIPFYNGVSLGDCIDFRPRISDDGTSFVGTGSRMSLIPKRGINIRTDYTYYLSRKTKIAIDFNGNFFAIDGVSSLNPGDPIDPAMGMVLYNLTLEPYTFSTSDNSVLISTYDNKRYTMRDIGKLEKRIDNLEYYTSLSLLEQQTESLEITDEFGDSRFKNGFIVDNFAGHSTGDTSSPDYFCSIDMENAELRPFFSMQNINMIEKNFNDSQRANSKYKLYGDVITLPVVDTPVLVKQEFASRLENINPFAIFTFLGQVQINPSSDDWFEVNRRPDIVNQVEGNFNTIKTLAEKAGVLGTVWNSWQTQWTGTSMAVSNQTFTAANARWGNGVWANARAINQGATQLTLEEMNARFGTGRGAGAPARQVTVQTVASQTGQSRTGVKTTVIAKIDRQVIADRVLSTATIPYIRSRNILVQVKGLKPNTRFYPFFDNIDVGKYCQSAYRVTYIPLKGVFDDSMNVGSDATDEARRIKNDTQVCLNKGDVIKGSVSGATGVVVGKEYNSRDGTYALYIVNHKGSLPFETNQGHFRPNDILTGSTTGATGQFVKYETWRGTSETPPLISNFNGELQLIFNIPNTDSIRFRTGVREFMLVDSKEANGEFTSRGRGIYRAEGVLETRQATVNAVRNGELVQEQVRDNRVIVQTSERVVSDTGWYDPLAQTFLVEQRGGAFLTKVDIFFATKDDRVPVNLEIREVVNGYPGKIILPFSRVSLKPEQIKLSNTLVQLDGISYPSYDTPTSFEFPSPVYVQDGQEYAIVLSSDSNNYRVWISQLGDQIPGSTRTISQQPYMGVFFKSQNASTWTADQMQDLKFTIYRAKFDTNSVANIEFINDVVPYQDLEFDPFETRKNISKVRVYQNNHGMPTGSRVRIDNSDDTKTLGIVGTGNITTTLGLTNIVGNGTQFTTALSIGSVIFNNNGQYIGIISSVTNNTNATLSSGAAITASGAFYVASPINGIPSTEIYTTHIISDVDSDSYCITVNTPPTTTGYAGGLTVRATRNIQFDAIQPNIQLQTFPDTITNFGVKVTTGKSPDSTSQQPYIQSTDFNPVLANETNTLFQPCMIASEINELNTLNGNDSLVMNVTMSTTNDSISPILDTHRTSLIIINNKVNNPSETNINVGGLDENVLISQSSNITIFGNQITTSDTNTMDIFKTAKVGKYMTIAGSTSGSSIRLITSVSSDGSSITFNTDPEECVGSITLTQREMFVDEISPEGSSSFSKYVTRQVHLTNASTFMRIRLAANIPSEASVEVYYRVKKVGSTTPLSNINYELIKSDAPITYVQNGSNDFIDMSYSTGDIDAFDTVQIKLVLKSSNTAAVPRIKDLRVIACA